MRPPRACLAIALVALLALLALTGLADARFVQGTRQRPPRSDRIIVHVNPDDGDVAGAAHGVAAATGLSYSNDLGNGFVVLDAPGEPNRAAGARLAIVAAMERGNGNGPPDTSPLGEAVARGKVTSAQEDYIVLPMAPPGECAAAGGCVSGTGGAGLWGMNAIDLPKLWGLILPDQRNISLPTSEQFRAGVIDTGVQFNHVQLENQLNRTDSRGYKRGAIVAADDSDSHGTHVSGTIAANWDDGPQGSLAGVVGTAELVHCRFLFAGGGTTADAMLCLDYLRKDKKVTISNNSWGGGGKSDALLLAIQNVCAAGGLFIVAAGNDGVDITAGRYPAYPAAYVTEPGAECVLPVAATDSTGTLASWSNFGANVSIAAPGVSIRSSVYSKTLNNREDVYSGTSMATPHVTGVALFLKNSFPALNGTQIKKAIVDSAKVQVKPYTAGNVIGGGLLNATAAYEAAAKMT